MSTPHLIGREREQRFLTELLDNVQACGAALVIRGEAGIGKSHLLAYAKDRAQEKGVRVLTTAGCESETHLPFAGLHQLLRPVVEGVDHLSTPQCKALQSAFGIIDETAPDPFLIALAALSLLSDAAAETPLLIIAEDAHWLDRPTRDALTFVARRLESDAIVLLIAAREEIEGPPVGVGLPDLHLERLGEAAAAALLEAYAPELSRPVRERLLENAAGIPLALIELPIALRTAGVVGETLTSTWLPLTTHLEQLFAKRITSLPEDTRTLLLVAAADEHGTLDELLEAAAVARGQPLTVAAVDSAVSAELVVMSNPGFRFRHPLVRSAVYQLANPSERQNAHAALATVLGGETDRRVWHRAHAVFGTDEDVAADLEAAAMRAKRRGATAVAAATLERAAQLSADPARTGGRLLRTAELVCELGRHADVVRLLKVAEPLALNPLESQRLAWLQEISREGAWGGTARISAFVEIANQMRLEGDTDRALVILLFVAHRCFWYNPEQETRDLVVAAAEKLLVPEDDLRLITILALTQPVEHSAIILERLAQLNLLDSHYDPEMLHFLGIAVMTLEGDYERAGKLLEAAAAGLRADGRLGYLARALSSQSWAAVGLGTWNLARRAAEEAGRLAYETDQPLWTSTARLAEAVLAAYRGEVEISERLAAEVEGTLPTPVHPQHALLQRVRGTASLADGRYEDAYNQLRRIFDPTDVVYAPHLHSQALADFAEAAVHSNKLDEVRAFVANLERLVVKTRSLELQTALSYVRPLLADAAEEEFQNSLQFISERWPFHRARLLLAYGMWLRRQRRVTESREPLRSARDMFDALGAAPWAERARTELRASGITSRPRTTGVSDTLSPQELQVAHMAAAGLSNSEIAQQLYLSPRSVSSHLYRAFPKLGITSRHQLSDTLTS